MFTIYGYNTFNPIKVMLTAEELGIDYRYVHVELGKGEQKQPDHQARHPLGKVPALDHDGEILLESAAICRYLARVHDNRLYAEAPLAAARIDSTMDMFTLHAGRWMGVYFWEEVICQRFFQREPNAADIAEAQGFLDAQLPHFDTVLSQQPFLCGDQVTLADTIAYAYCQIQEITSLDLSAHANLQRWYGEFSERPSVTAVKQRFAELKG